MYAISTSVYTPRCTRVGLVVVSDNSIAQMRGSNTNATRTLSSAVLLYERESAASLRHLSLTFEKESQHPVQLKEASRSLPPEPATLPLLNPRMATSTLQRRECMTQSAHCQPQLGEYSTSFVQDSIPPSIRDCATPFSPDGQHLHKS